MQRSLVEQAIKQDQRNGQTVHATKDGSSGDDNIDFQGRVRPPDLPDPEPPTQMIGEEPPAKPSLDGDGGKGPVFPPIKRASELLAVNVDQKWLWHGCLARGSTTLFSALWKAGKTTFISYLLRAFEKDKKFCGMGVSPTKVLYVTEESETRWA